MTAPKVGKPAGIDGKALLIAAGGIVLTLLLVPVIKEIFFKRKGSDAPEKSVLPETSVRPKDIGGYQQKGW